MPEQTRSAPRGGGRDPGGALGVAGISFALQITSSYLAAANPDGVLMLCFGVCLMFICGSVAG